MSERDTRLGRKVQVTSNGKFSYTNLSDAETGKNIPFSQMNLEINQQDGANLTVMLPLDVMNLKVSANLNSIVARIFWVPVDRKTLPYGETVLCVFDDGHFGVHKLRKYSPLIKSMTYWAYLEAPVPYLENGEKIQ